MDEFKLPDFLLRPPPNPVSMEEFRRRIAEIDEELSTFDHLSSEELTFLEAIGMGNRVDDRGCNFHFSRLLRGWYSAILSVEAPVYALGVEGYTNDLSTRTMLLEITQKAPKNLRDKLTSKLALWDARFEAQTVPVAEPLWENVQTSEWWFYRLPKRYGRRMKDGLDGTI